MCHVTRKSVLGFRARFNTKHPVQSQKKARLKEVLHPGGPLEASKSKVYFLFFQTDKPSFYLKEHLRAAYALCNSVRFLFKTFLIVQDMLGLLGYNGAIMGYVCQILRTSAHRVLSSIRSFLLFIQRVLIEHVREKTNNLGSDQVQHKPACTVSEES